MDLRRVEATSNDTGLTVEMELEDSPPVVDPITTEVSYGFFIDVNGDSEPDFQVLVSNFGDGGEYEGSISAIDTGATQGGPDFPGAVEIAGNLVLIRVSADAIGDPPSIKVATFSEWIFYPDPEAPEFDMVTDQAPDVIWPEADSDWIEVAP